MAKGAPLSKQAAELLGAVSAAPPSTRAGAPMLPRSADEKQQQRRIFVVLEHAALETVKTKRGYELLNGDDHRGILLKNGRDPAAYRPDITHQLLLTLLDSPLNKAGLLQIYVSTSQRVLIEVSPQLRIPRTYKRFAGLMVQLLHRMRVRAAGAPQTLLRVVKNPVTTHLPAGAPIVGTNMKAELIHPGDLMPRLPATGPIVFVFGAMAKGFLKADYVEESYSFSRYPLSADTAVSRLLREVERQWGIL